MDKPLLDDHDESLGHVRAFSDEEVVYRSQAKPLHKMIGVNEFDTSMRSLSDEEDDPGTDGDVEDADVMITGDGTEINAAAKKKTGTRSSTYDEDGVEYFSDASMQDKRGGKERTHKYHSYSDSALSEDEQREVSARNSKRMAFQKRLPMIPSKARFRESGKRVQYNSYAALPRKIPRRIKGKFRRIVADEEEQITGRIAVYCASNEIDLDEVYARMLQVRQEFMGKEYQMPKAAEKFSFETNRQAIVPTIHPVDSRAGSSKSTGANRNTVESPTWTASIFFDVLHLRQRIDEGRSAKRQDSEPRISLNSEEGNGGSLGGVRVRPRRRKTSEEFDDYEDGWAYHDTVYPTSGHREVFLFGFGCVVFWNWESEELEKVFVRSLVPYSQRFYEPEAAESAADDMEYYYGEKPSVKNDKVELSSGDPFERLAVSFAFAQSSLLSMYEFRLDQIIERNEHIPVTLAKTGKIKMSQEEISKEIGRLFMERNMINLESELMGTPTAFWEHDEWEHVYKKMCNYMEQDDRLEILNKRLDCVRELLDVLASQVENQHASKLEWIIIWLILSEVLVAVVWGIFVKDIGGYFNHCGG